ncbi:putative ribonuclease H-like domain-containing protein [Tanacetum coccineum]
MDKCKTGLGYNVVLPSYTGNFMPPKPDLVYPSLDDFVDVNEFVSESVIEKPTVETNEPKTARKENGAPIIEDWVSESDEQDEPKQDTYSQSFSPSRSPRGNKRNWNQQMSQKLGSDFEMFNKACHVCGSFDHLKKDCNNWYNNGRFAKPVWTNVQMVNKQNFSKLIHPSPKRNMVPRTVLSRSGPILINTVRPVNTVQPRTTVNNAGPMKNVIKNAYSTARRPFNNITAANNCNFTKKVNTIKRTRVNTTRPKVVLSDVKEDKGIAVKASACWIMKKLMDDLLPLEELKFNLFSASQMCDKKNNVLFTDTECVVLSPSFKLTNESHVLLKVPRKDNMHRKSNRPYKVKIIRCDNGTEFKNKEMNQFCEMKGVKREFSVARTPQQKWSISSKEDDKDDQDLRNEFESLNGENDVNSTNNINNVSSIVNTACIKDNAVDENIVYGCADDPNIPNLEEIVYSDDDEDNDAEIDMNNLNTFMPVSPIPIQKFQGSSIEQSLEILHSALQPELDERGIVIRNKARLVAQGYTQEEGINYDDVFDPVARIEAIGLFLAYALFKDFIVYQIDVKSAFLYSKIEEEVYVCQPLGFKDLEFPDRVYKVEKALYGIHQAPRAWYETLSTYLLDNGFQRGQIDKTVFIKRVKSDILLVQVYVDDIIFGSTKKELCTEFEKLMHKKFRISSIGELTFFLGLQVMQKDDGIFISHDKYVDEILKKFGFLTVKTASTPIETSKPLMKDENAEDVNVHLYRSMIGSLMYLTSSRPDIMFIVCACARFQVTPKVSQVHAVKRIFKYLKGQPKLGLWYPKDSPFNLNLVFHSKTKHIEIRHHFIRDSNKKKLIQMIKIYTDQNVADLLTKAFDVGKFQYLVASIGMLNL